MLKWCFIHLTHKDVEISLNFNITKSILTHAQVQYNAILEPIQECF